MVDIDNDKAKVRYLMDFAQLYLRLGGWRERVGRVLTCYCCDVPYDTGVLIKCETKGAILLLDTGVLQ